MIKLFFILFFIYISLIGYSLFFKSIVLSNKEYKFYNLDIFYGIFVTVLIAIILNFFIPLVFLGYFFVPVGLFFLIFLRKKYLFENNFLIFSLILFFFIFISYSNGSHLAGDTPYYHLQTIKWSSNYKISFGLANLEPRYGMNSLWHILISIFNIPIFNVNPIYHFNLIIYAITFNEIFNKKNYDTKKISFGYLYLTLSFFLIYSYIHPMINGTIFLNLGSPEVDTISMLLFILSGFLFIKVEKSNDESDISILLILTTLCYLTKLSYVVSILFILFLLINKKSLLKIKIIPYIILINIIWVMRNFFISGCGIFPFKFTCLNFSWTYDLSKIEIFSKIIRSFSRDTPLRAKYMDFNYTLKTFDWLVPWFKTYFLETSLLIICSLIALISFLFFILYELFFKKIELSKSFYLFFIICFLSICLWFQAPEIRFGYGYIISFSILLFLTVFNVFNKKFNFINKITLNLVMVVLISANFYKNYNNINKINSDIEHKFNYKNFILISENNNFNFFKPPSSFSCGFFSEICVYADEKYIVSSKFNYLTFKRIK